MKIVLSNGFEAELLNEFSPAGSQVTLIPPLTAAEANPLSVDPIDVYEPEANPEAVTAVTISPISSAEDDFARALQQFNDDMDGNSWQWLSAEQLTLQEQRRNIALAPELNVVFHGRWQQPVPPRDAPQRILLPVENLQLSTEFMRLNGHIGITSADTSTPTPSCGYTQILLQTNTRCCMRVDACAVANCTTSTTR